MSIILDALNKLEDSQDKVNLIPSPEPNKPKGKKKKFLLYLFLIVLGLVTARTIFTVVPKYLSISKLRPEAAVIRRDYQKLQTAKASSAAKANNISIESVKQTINTLVNQAPKPLKMAINNTVNRKELVLNGIVFSSKDDSYALVNNKIVKSGDIIDGFNVVAISENEVELRSEDSSVIRLSLKAI